jgi:dTDP-glucose pyrophosphorylase
MSKVTNLAVGPTCSVREVMEQIDRSGKGIALVLDESQRLLGTVTDGDIRRAILTGIDLDTSVEQLLGQREDRSGPLTAPIGTSDSTLLHLMNESGVRQIPLIDENDRVVDVTLLSDLVKEFELPIRAIVMAGGLGTRLRPLTDTLPKPMLPIGSRPLLELIVEGLKESGIRRLNVATHYKGEIISEHFKDGQDFGVEITYVKEDQPLGTVGALSLLEDSEDPLLVINGDILTRVDFREMLNFHREHKADLTIAVRQYEFDVPYGVVESDGVFVKGISEKPTVRQFINAGIYLLNPSVRRLVPNQQQYDMPDLIHRILSEGRQVVCFPVREYWLDIGIEDHYLQAQADVEKLLEK